MQELQSGDPEQVGPYRLTARLGGGGMGRVFLGWSLGGRLVAVKVIRDDLAADPEFRVRFAREVAAAKSVSGMYTAPVVDADTDGPVPWLATAYVAGPSLTDAVREHGPLPLATVRALAAGLAEGLAAIHAAGLVHRDVKPSNVLLADDGPRVIDFGITRAVEASTLTQSGLMLGSPGFMSPEQAEGRPAGPPSDVFGLGGVLAFAATGHGPFGDGSAIALAYRVVHSAPQLDGVPAELRPLIERCLAKEPEQRPDVREILAELGGANLTAGWLPTAVRSDIGQGVTDRTQTAPGGTVTTDSPAQPSSRPSAPADPGGADGRPRRPNRRIVLVSSFAAVLAAAAVAFVLLSNNLSGGSGQPPATPATGTATAGTHGTATAAASVTASRQSSGPAATVALAAPGQVAAVAVDQYTIRVTWADASSGVTGFRVDNGCPAGACGGPDAELATTTGPGNSAVFTVTPGAYECFRVQAVNSSGSSPWSRYGCAQTSGLAILGTQQWTDTGVNVKAGDRVNIRASGVIHPNPLDTETPAGNVSCTPAATYPEQTNPPFPAPHAACWSLIGRIGNGPAFAVGDTAQFTATATGRLYLGVNDYLFLVHTGNWTAKIEKGASLPP